MHFPIARHSLRSIMRQITAVLPPMPLWLPVSTYTLEANNPTCEKDLIMGAVSHRQWFFQLITQIWLGDDVCNFICLHFFLSFLIISLLLFPYYYFLIIISCSDLVITNNSGRIASIMRYHSICPFRVSATLIGSSVTSRGAKIPISLTKMSLLWRATPPPTTIIFNFALFQGILFHLLYPFKEGALIYLVLWWRSSAAKVAVCVLRV